VQNRTQGSNTPLLIAALLVLFLCSCADENPLPPVSLPQSLPRSMKGYELYSWRSGRAWRFTLVTGTNRLKTLAEITSPDSIVENEWVVKVTVEGIPELKATLERLPAGETVSWWAARDLPYGSPVPRARLGLPRSRVKEIQSYCSERGIELTVDR
jgi:hypothetical protein